MLLFAAGCHHKAAAGQDATGPDPAEANLAPVNGQAQVLGANTSYEPQQEGEAYPEGQQAPAPIVRGTPYDDQNAYPGGYGPDDAEQAGEEAIEQTDQAPPPLPEYDQPPAPGPDYIWTPGYWAWGPDGYYWVPGAWVEAPYYGALWTPPWWGWYGGYYRFHPGYWGPHVGYYGGIDYGFGYIGIGYFGGYWRDHHFYYNRAVTHVGGNIHNYYDRPVVYDNHRYDGRPRTRISYNGGHGGINVRPRPAELAASRERHEAPIPAQRQLRSTAAQNRSQFFHQNHGRPSSVVETRGFANTHGIAPTSRGVRPGRTGVEPGRPGGVAPNGAGRPERGFQNGGQNGVQGARPGEPPRVNGGRMNPGQPGQPGQPNTRGERGFQNGQPGQPNTRGERGVQPGQPGSPQERGFQPGQSNHNDMRYREAPGARSTPQTQPQSAPQPRVENRPAPQQQRMEQPRVENRPAPQQQHMQQQRMENRAAPQQQRMEQPRVENRPAPQQQHMQQQRMESRPAPQQQRMQQPRVENHPAPQARGGGPLAGDRGHSDEGHDHR